MATKDRLHRMVDALPEEDVPAAEKALEGVRMERLRRALAEAPEDDEPLTEAEREAIEEAEEEIRQGARPIPHEEIMREFGGG